MAKVKHTDYTNKFKSDNNSKDSLHDIREDEFEEVPMITTDETIEIPTSVDTVPASPYGYVDIDEVAHLRLREEPNTDGKILARLANGTKLLIVHDDTPEWLFVEDLGSGVAGFVMRKFVTLPS